MFDSFFRSNCNQFFVCEFDSQFSNCMSVSFRHPSEPNSQPGGLERSFVPRTTIGDVRRKRAEEISNVFIFFFVQSIPQKGRKLTMLVYDGVLEISFDPVTILLFLFLFLNFSFSSKTLIPLVCDVGAIARSSNRPLLLMYLTINQR